MPPPRRLVQQTLTKFTVPQIVIKFLEDHRRHFSSSLYLGYRESICYVQDDECHYQAFNPETKMKVGWVCLEEDADDYYLLAGLEVVLEFRRRGIGRQLISYANQRITAKNATLMISMGQGSSRYTLSPPGRRLILACEQAGILSRDQFFMGAIPTPSMNADLVPGGDIPSPSYYPGTPTYLPPSPSYSTTQHDYNYHYTTGPNFARSSHYRRFSSPPHDNARNAPVLPGYGMQNSRSRPAYGASSISPIPEADD